MIKFSQSRLITLNLLLIIQFSLILTPNSITNDLFNQNNGDSKEIESEISINEFLKPNSENKIENHFKFSKNIDKLDTSQVKQFFEQQKIAQSEYKINDTKSFWALDLDADPEDYSNAYYQLDATLVANSSHSYIFVENSLVPNWEGKNGPGERLSGSFDEIYDCEVPFFGTPSDVDNNTKIIILVLAIRTSQYQIAGFFSSLNWYPKSTNPTDIDFYSNHADLIYINENLDSSSRLATLAHEFQHLIQFNMDQSEDVWLDEGLSMYAEKLTGHDYTISDYINNGNGFGSNIDLSLTYWQYKNVDHYGASYLFLLYLSDRFGKDFISQISNDGDKTGMDSINGVLKSYNQDLTIRKIFQDWAIALAINDVQSAPYFFHNYSSTVIPQSTWKIDEEQLLLEQKINHWGNDIVNLSSEQEGEYWITFRAESSIWKNESERNYHLNLVQYDSSSNSWLIERLNHTEPISLILDSRYSKSFLIISSSSGTSSGYYPAEPPIDWISNYHLFMQEKTSTLPLIKIESINETFTKIIIPFPQSLNGSNWSVPILTDLVLRIHSAVSGRSIKTFNTLLWDDQDESFYYELENSAITDGDYFLSAKLSSAGKSVTLYSQNWKEKLPNISINSSHSTETSTEDPTNIYGFFLITIVLTISVLTINRRYRRKN